MLLELEYLFEIGRIKTEPISIVKYLEKQIDLRVDKSSFYNIIGVAIKEKWTRDPFDRIIVAHCKYKDANLITKDRVITDNYQKVIF